MTGPFDPEGVQWTALSPRAVPAWRLAAAIPSVVIALGAGASALVFDTPWPWIAVVVCLIWLVTSWIVVPRQARSWGYAEREDDFLVRHGILDRNLVVVPYGRMQFVDVNAGPFDRMFGIATVQLHTASSATDASIPGLAPAEAARLRDRLASRGQARLAGL